MASNWRKSWAIIFPRISQGGGNFIDFSTYEYFYSFSSPPRPSLQCFWKIQFSLAAWRAKIGCGAGTYFQTWWQTCGVWQKCSWFSNFQLESMGKTRQIKENYNELIHFPNIFGVGIKMFIRWIRPYVCLTFKLKCVWEDNVCLIVSWFI